MLYDDRHNDVRRNPLTLTADDGRELAATWFEPTGRRHRRRPARARHGHARGVLRGVRDLARLARVPHADLRPPRDGERRGDEGRGRRRAPVVRRHGRRPRPRARGSRAVGRPSRQLGRPQPRRPGGPVRRPLAAGPDRQRRLRHRLLAAQPAGDPLAGAAALARHRAGRVARRGVLPRPAARRPRQRAGRRDAAVGPLVHARGLPRRRRPPRSRAVRRGDDPDDGAVVHRRRADEQGQHRRPPRPLRATPTRSASATARPSSRSTGWATTASSAPATRTSGTSWSSRTWPPRRP